MTEQQAQLIREYRQKMQEINDKARRDMVDIAKINLGMMTVANTSRWLDDRERNALRKRMSVFVAESLAEVLS